MQTDRLTRDPNIVGGKLRVQGTRLPVYRVLYVLAQYPDREDLRRNYPSLDDEDIRQCLFHAAKTLEDSEPSNQNDRW